MSAGFTRSGRANPGATASLAERQVSQISGRLDPPIPAGLIHTLGLSCGKRIKSRMLSWPGSITHRRSMPIRASRLAPILNLQSGNPAELFGVAAHQRQSVRQADRGNFQIIRADEQVAGFQLVPDDRVMPCGSVIEGHGNEGMEHFFQCDKPSLTPAILVRAMPELSLHHRAEQDFRRRELAEPPLNRAPGFFRC